jgi:prepilin-type N-terminal cleavage/methylation domain-containing protein
MRDEDGFTLAEMLVALTLFALIAAYSTSALLVFSNVQRVESGLDAKAAELAALRSIQVSLSGLRPAFIVSESGKLTPGFRGTSKNVSFVAPLDDRLERGGLYNMNYSVDASSRRLVLRYQIHRGVDAMPIEEVAMLDNVSRLAFRYSGDGAIWEDQWISDEKLPVLIEVQLGEDRRLIAIPAAP